MSERDTLVEEARKLADHYQNRENYQPADVLYRTADAIESLTQELAERTRMTKQITHCVDCGASWYDDGNNGTSCPYCALAAETLKRRQVEHERDCMLEGLASAENLMNQIMKRIESLERELERERGA